MRPTALERAVTTLVAAALAVAVAASAALAAPLGHEHAASPTDPPGTLGKRQWHKTDVGAPFGGLSSIAVEGKAIVAVGFSMQPSLQFSPLAVSWNGKRWRPQTTKVDARLAEVQLTDVDLLTNRSGWAVGHGLVDGVSEAVSVRWDGRVWREVPIMGLPSNVALHGVSALADDSVWAAGQLQAGPTLQSMLAHYDGATWTNVDVPPLEDVGDDTALLSISASTPNNVWAVGRGGVAVHLSGAGWSQILVPKVDGLRVDLTKVRIFGPTDVWAVGYVPTRDGERPVAMRWDGTGFKLVDVTTTVTAAQLSDVVRTGRSTAAVGYESEGAPRFFGLRLSADSAALPLRLPKGKDALFGAAYDPKKDQMWVVGSGAVGEQGDLKPFAAYRD